MRRPGLVYPILLLVCWTGVIVAADYALLDTTFRQFRALQFPTTRGRILQSELGHGTISRRGVDIAYNYIVNGAPYTGHRYRYDDRNATLQWESAVTANPLRSRQKIYYNPRNPSDSLLAPGIDGCDLLLLLFALPLNILTCGLWRAAISSWREKSGRGPGVPILRCAGETRAHLAGTSPLAATFYGMAAAAFLAAFPVVALAGFDPAMPLMRMTWAMVLLAGLGAFFWRMMRDRSGVYDLRVNTVSREVTLPKTAGRKEPLAMAREEISGVSLQRRVSRSPSGALVSYLPVLKDRTSQPVKLIAWGWSESKARAFSEWLSEELNVEFKGVEEETPGH